MFFGLLNLLVYLNLIILGAGVITMLCQHIFQYRQNKCYDKEKKLNLNTKEGMDMREYYLKQRGAFYKSIDKLEKLYIPLVIIFVGNNIVVTVLFILNFRRR
jgi:hypothetical protein